MDGECAKERRHGNGSGPGLPMASSRQRAAISVTGGAALPAVLRDSGKVGDAE